MHGKCCSSLSICGLGTWALLSFIASYASFTCIDSLFQNNHQVSKSRARARFTGPEAASEDGKLLLGSNPISYFYLWRALCKNPVWRWVHFNTISSGELRWKPERHLKIDHLQVQLYWLEITPHLLIRGRLRWSPGPACVSAQLGLDSSWKWSSHFSHLHPL